jgi:hypothetical protein
VTELIGLLTADGREKAWAREFRTLARQFAAGVPARAAPANAPAAEWDRLLVDAAARDAFRAGYFEWFRQLSAR